LVPQSSNNYSSSLFIPIIREQWIFISKGRESQGFIPQQREDAGFNFQEGVATSFHKYWDFIVPDSVEIIYGGRVDGTPKVLQKVNFFQLRFSRSLCLMDNCKGVE